MNTKRNSSPRTGTIAAIGAFTIWGLLPMYWARIGTVPALEVLGHRVVWGGVLAWLIVAARRWMSGGIPAGAIHTDAARAVPSAHTVPAAHTEGIAVRVDPADAARAVPSAHTDPSARTEGTAREPWMPRGRVLKWLLFNGVLVVGNWYVYVWAVSSGRTLDASLGYYINPLVSVFLGMVFLGERLTPLQWPALASATVGVVYLTVSLGVFPWVSLTLAFTFGTYGLIKKRTRLASIHSLAVELLPVFPVAAGFLALRGIRGEGRFLAGDPVTSLYLWGAGLVTVMPLLLFGIAARRIRLADVGFLQYIAPTMMFIVAVLVFRDPLEPQRLAGFAFVWIGLALYTASNFSRRRESPVTKETR